MAMSVRRILVNQSVEASAPCRIDAGGTWDIKAMALPLEGIRPTTVNMALTLRTTVLLTPHEKGWVKISSDGFPAGENFREQETPFDSPFGLFFAATSYFGFHGLKIHITSRSPVQSALGGSSTALVALLKALSKVAVAAGLKGLTAREILHLGYHLEDGISGGNCGIQDQAAAVYGGVHRWDWHYGNPKAMFQRTPLLDRKGQQRLSKHLLVCYCGKRHISSTTNRKWIRDFLSGRTRAGWVKVNGVVGLFAEAVKAQNWIQAARFLKEEMALRREITPEALIPVTEKLVEQAEHLGCGARFAGAGAGGSLWALGTIENIEELKKKWGMTLSRVRGGGLLDCEVDPEGLK